MIVEAFTGRAETDELLWSVLSKSYEQIRSAITIARRLLFTLKLLTNDAFHAHYAHP